MSCGLLHFSNLDPGLWVPYPRIQAEQKSAVILETIQADSKTTPPRKTPAFSWGRGLRNPEGDPRPKEGQLINSSSYAGLFSHPTYLVVHLTTGLFSVPYCTLQYILPRPTLYCSAILPYLYTTNFYVLHWIVQPSYLTLSYILPTSPRAILTHHYGPLLELEQLVGPSHILLHLSSSYTGLFSHPTLCSPVLPQPSSFNTLDCSILPCRTTYHNHILPYWTPHYFFVLHWIVQPSYHIVPYHTSYNVLPRGRMFGVLHWIVHPTLLRPTLDCSAILP